MNEWIEISAKTVDEAIIEATLQLGTSSDNMEYEVKMHQSSYSNHMFEVSIKDINDYNRI